MSMRFQQKSDLRDRARQRPAQQEGQTFTGPKVAKKTMAILEDTRAFPTPRDKRAFVHCKEEVEKRGGRLELVERGRVCRVEGEVRVVAGSDLGKRLVMVAQGGDLCTKTLTYRKGVDESVVSTVKGYGMGALEVTYKVDPKDNAEYVIRTNGSYACLEKNKVNVAMALAGAAQIVEEMVSPKENAEVVELGRKAA